MKEILIKKPTYQVMVGSVPVGGGSPIVVQSMTNTDTADIQKTVEQVFDLWKAGSEIVRVTVNNEASADAIPHIIEALQKKTIAGAGLDVYVDEPNVPAELRKLDNVVLTPHVASGTVETRKAMSALALANLDAHMSGKPVITPVPECRS